MKKIFDFFKKIFQQKTKENEVNFIDKRRPVDKTAEEAASWLNNTFVMMEKTKVQTWKGIFILGIFAGAAVGIIWNVSLKIQTLSHAAGENARIFLVSPDMPTSNTIVGETFNVNVLLDTDSANVVATRAIINYNPTDFSLVEGSVNITNNVFGVNNFCVSGQNPTEICAIVDTTTAGKIDITLSKPSPGVNVDSGLIVAFTLTSLSEGNKVISLSRTGNGNYNDCDIITDNGLGTNILSSVENLNITVNPLDTTAPILNNEEISQEEIDSNNGVNIGKIKVKTEKNNKTKNISGKIYSQGKSLYFKGEVEGLSGGKMKVMIDNKVKKEINLGNGADWKVKLKFNKSKTYNVQFQYVDSNGNVVDESKKYKVEVDKKKPKFVNFPPFLVKKPGEVI